MSIRALGYMGFTSDKLEDWASFGTQLLGLQLVERTSDFLKFRMDDRKQRLWVRRGTPGVGTYGWEVADAASLEKLAARLEAHQVRCRPLESAELAMRGVTGGIRFSDPGGNELEAFYGAESETAPFVPGRSISGFRTGPLGAGHAVLQVERVEELRSFYVDVLGFRLTDYFLRPFPVYFFHVNERHHSFAIAETGKPAIHHVMIELNFLDDVGQGYDIALAEEGRVATTLGRHLNDLMTSFYPRTPDDFLVEYGWGGRRLDLDSWEPHEVQYGSSLWGHERYRMSPEKRLEAQQLRLQAARDGLRQPVQVAADNYHTEVSGCAWWERVAPRAAR